LLLDRVKPGAHEVTIDADGYTPEQVDRIYATAKARGLHASGTRRWILIRDLRDQAEARARTSHGDMSAAANRSPLVTVALIDAADKAVGRDVSPDEIRRALSLWATHSTPSIRAELKRAEAEHRRAPSAEIARVIDTMRIAIAVRTWRPRTGASRHGDVRRRESDFEVVATDGRQLYFGTSSSAALAAFEDHIGSGAMMLKDGRVVKERGPRRLRKSRW
jgi:hypothetical protein